MGAFELFLGFFFIPSMLIILILLSLKCGRRQINSIVLKLVNVHITVNGS